MDELELDVGEEIPSDASFPETEEEENREAEKASPDPTDDVPDYDELIRRDLEALRGEFRELAQLRDITELNNPMRYAALRDLGLSPAEAYMATRKRAPKKDNRSHLVSAVARAAASPIGGMSRRELEEARNLFSGMSDSEIQGLYKRVIK